MNDVVHRYRLGELGVVHRYRLGELDVVHRYRLGELDVVHRYRLRELDVVHRYRLRELDADDIDGLAGEEEELASLVVRLDKASTAYGMKISAEKTKLMTNNTSTVASTQRSK